MGCPPGLFCAKYRDWNAAFLASLLAVGAAACSPACFFARAGLRPLSADAQNRLNSYKNFSGNHLCAPFPLHRFIDYGLWFQHTAIPDVDRRSVTRVQRERAGFLLTLEDRGSLSASRVVVASGLATFPVRPSQFQGLPAALVSHSSEHQDLSSFSGKHVAVIGGGQSALEPAALLAESKADVETIVRRPQIHWLGWKERLQCLGPFYRALYSEHDVGPAGISCLVAAPDLLKNCQNASKILCEVFPFGRSGHLACGAPEQSEDHDRHKRHSRDSCRQPPASE
jgi:pyridine nucleotide-disulfide oxidoreductase